MTAAPPSLVGRIEFADRQTIKGWALDQRAPERSVSLEISTAGHVIAEVVASAFRWDLQSRFKSSGNHGFVYQFPAEVLAKTNGRFDVRFAGTSQSLAGSPIDIAPVAERLHAPFTTSSLTGRRVLMLAPHQDDESLTCGGSLLLHTQHGDPVKVVFLTDGSQADSANQQTPAAYAKTRRKEAAGACAILGVTDMEFWNYPDRGLAGAPGLLDRLTRLLADYQPQLIYAPSPLEFHPDHRAAAELIWAAVPAARIEADVAFYESNRPIHINRLVNIDSTHARKIQACQCYVSQIRNHPYVDIVDGLSRYRALTVSPAVRNAEGFFVLSSAEIAGHPLDWFTVRQHLPMAAPAPRPLVSVIIRTRDRPQLLREALSSLLTQTYTNIEVVLVNAGTNDLGPVTSEFAGFFPILVVGGDVPLNRSAAANAGLRAAKGDFVNFLDDDDLVYASHIEKLAGFLERTGERVAYSDSEQRHYAWTDGGFAPAGDAVPFHGAEFDRDRLLFQNFLPLMAVMFSRSLTDDAGFFDEQLDVLEDWDFWIRLSALATFHRVPGVTAQYRLFLDRRHGDHTERLHRKHIEDWTESGPPARERIRTLQAENARLMDRLSEVHAELGLLHGRLAWQAMQSARGLLKRYRLEALLPVEEPSSAVAEPFSDWRKGPSTTYVVIEGLQRQNIALRDRLAAAERRLRAIRRAPLARIAGMVPQRWLSGARRAYRRIERTRVEQRVADVVREGDAIEVRPYLPGDETHILPLFELCFGKSRSLRHWTWKFVNHPWGARRIMVATTSSGRVVGHFGGYPSYLRDATGDQPVRLLGLQIGDTMTAPEVRHVGSRRSNLLHKISQRYFAHYCEGQVHLIFGFNTGKIQRYYLKLVPGMFVFEEVPFKVLRLDTQTRVNLSAIALRQPGLLIRRVRHTDQAWDAFFDTQAPHYGLLTQRDAAYVRWRYLEAPDSGYRLYAAYDQGVLVGWSVFRQDGPRLQWGDGLFAPESSEAFGAILHHAASRFSARRAQSIEGWFSRRPDWWAHTVSALGFESRPEPDHIGMIFKCFLAPDLRPVFERNLYYSKGDSDLF